MKLIVSPFLRYERLAWPAMVLGAVVLSGTAAYHSVGGGRWTWFECLYMTIITLSTVGFAETLPGMNDVQSARMVTLGLIVFGSGTLLYFISMMTAVIVESDIQGILRRRRMDREIRALRGHIIICGAGNTGKHAIAGLIAGGKSFVVIDEREDRLQELTREFRREFPYVIGDATDDHVLEEAGIDGARGVIAAINDDKANLFVTISARALNPHARIVSKAIEATTEAKLRRAGADAVVSPNYIGGARLVSEMVHPQTVAFLDKILTERREYPVGIEVLDVPPSSPLVGKTFAEAGLREAGALVIAVHRPNGDYVYNPGSEHTVEAGESLIVLAESKRVKSLRARVSVGA